MSNRLSHQFFVNQISGQEFDTDTLLTIHKRREYVSYKTQVSHQHALIDYATGEEVVPTNNLSIVDRSTAINANQVVDISDYSTFEASTLVTDTDKILITDVFTEELSTKAQAPLFYSHTISSDHFNPALGHKIIGLRLLDDTLNEVSIADKLVDLDTGVYYNNIEHSYNSGDGSYVIYYLQYSIKESPTSVKVYTVILNNTPIYRLAEITDFTSGGLFITGRKVYTLEELAGESFLFTLPLSTSYAYRKLTAERIALLPPTANSISSPWFIRVSNGAFFHTVGATSYKYHIAEIYNQTFFPYLPYRRAQNEPVAVLSKNLYKLTHGKVFESVPENLFIDVLVRDADLNLKYAFTTEEAKSGTLAGLDADGEEVLYFCLAAGDKYGIRSVDYRWGFLDIYGLEIAGDDEVFCSYYYECSDLELTSVNLNPISNQDMIDRGLVVFLRPDPPSYTYGESIFLLVTDRDGRVVESTWDELAVIEAAGDYLFYGEAPDWFKTEYGAEHCINFLTDYTVNEGTSGNFLVLGEVYVKQSSSPDNFSLLDVRQHGGGLRKDSALRETEEAYSCWSLGAGDGRPYPGAACFLVELPVEVMDGAGGSFNSKQIREIVERHVAYGVYPVIRAYGIDPRITSILPGYESIYIEWTHSDADVYYNVYVGTTREGPFAADNADPIIENPSLNSYTISSLKNNVSYYIYVVGGKYVDSVWIPYSEQVVGPQSLTAKGATSLEIIQCMPGSEEIPT